jgi:hypothetical protein
MIGPDSGIGLVSRLMNGAQLFGAILHFVYVSAAIRDGGLEKSANRRKARSDTRHTKYPCLILSLKEKWGNSSQFIVMLRRERPGIKNDPRVFADPESITTTRRDSDRKTYTFA